MPIEFRCTKCGKLLRTPDETGGRQARCPECGTILAIPARRAGGGRISAAWGVGFGQSLSSAGNQPDPAASLCAKLQFADAYGRAWRIFRRRGRCVSWSSR